MWKLSNTKTSASLSGMLEAKTRFLYCLIVLDTSSFFRYYKFIMASPIFFKTITFGGDMVVLKGRMKYDQVCIQYYLYVFYWHANQPKEKSISFPLACVFC